MADGKPRVVQAPRPPKLGGRRLADALAESRADTLDRLKADVGMYSQTVARHDEAIEKWLRPIATELPGQMETLKLAIARLDATVANAAGAASAFAEETRRTIREHDVRITAVEERGADHHTKWMLLDAERLPPRVAALEQQVETAEIDDMIDTALVAQQRKWLSFALRHSWKVICAVQAAALAYLGLGG